MSQHQNWKNSNRQFGLMSHTCIILRTYVMHILQFSRAGWQQKHAWTILEVAHYSALACCYYQSLKVEGSANLFWMGLHVMLHKLPPESLTKLLSCTDPASGRDAVLPARPFAVKVWTVILAESRDRHTGQDGRCGLHFWQRLLGVTGKSCSSQLASQNYNMSRVVITDNVSPDIAAFIGFLVLMDVASLINAQILWQHRSFCCNKLCLFSL